MRNLLCSAALLLSASVFAAEIEAESGKSATTNGTVISKTGASGGKAVRLNRSATSISNKPTQNSRADWIITIPAAKTTGAKITFRYFSDASGDSFYYSFNNGQIKECHLGNYPQGNSRNFGIFDLNKGDNILKIWNREPGVILDKFEVTEVKQPRRLQVFDLQNAVLNTDRAEFANGGITLKSGMDEDNVDVRQKADVEFTIKAAPGRYWLVAETSISQEGYDKIKKLNKFASPRTNVLVGEQYRPKLCIFVPWSRPEFYRSKLAKFEFDGTPQKVKLTLPPHVTLKKLFIHPYTPPAIPPQVLAWKPTVQLPADRPRLLMTAKDLPQIRKNLLIGENKPVWDRIQQAAARPIKITVPEEWMRYVHRINAPLTQKAFVALIKNDKQLAREVIELTDKYLSMVEFGNMLDVTRELGATLHSAAYVYDWCYNYMTPEERTRISKRMVELADDMECGWPPFLQSIINGHGNEHQMTRDLFAVAVAIHDENPLPYQIIAYRMTQELTPAHTYEYASGRHNQGTSYGMSRFSCDMMGAWNAKRTWDFKLFGDTLAKVPYMWVYTRLPNGEMMRDGDDFTAYQQRGRYWSNLNTFFLCYTYNNDPILKGETLRMGNPANLGLLFLIFNDPNLEAQPDRSSLPLTYMAKEPYPAMVARTGWDFGDKANDAIVYHTGAGLNSQNHQHLNSGDFQIWYRGILAADLGSYFYYGKPYDMQFNKQSISHNVMLFKDPANAKDNGGQYYPANSPSRMDQMEKTRVGYTRASGFGPDAKLPLYSYMKTDLAKAYPKGKLDYYERTLITLNNSDAEAPMTVIVADRTSANPKYKKYWQLNSFTVPKKVEGTFEILSLNGDGKLTLIPVYPAVNHEILSGKASHSVFGKQYEAPRYELPEANGSRLMLSPEKAAQEDRFLNVIQLTRSSKQAEQPAVRTVNGAEHIYIGNWIVVRNPAGGTLSGVKKLAVETGNYVLITDLAPGNYEIAGMGGQEVDKNGLFFFRAEKSGNVTLKQVKSPGKKLDNSKALAPKVTPTQINF